MINNFCKLILAVSLIGQPLNAAVLYSLPADNELNENITFGSVTGITMRVGMSGSAPVGGRNALMIFQMPDLGAVSNPFTSSSLSVTITSLSGTFTQNGDLYGLGLQSSGALAIGSGVLATNRYFESALDAGATLIQDSFLSGGSSTSTGTKTTSTGGGTALLSYLNSLYNSGAGANQYVVFRVNPDADMGSTEFLGYNIASGNHTASPVPTLTYTAVPEPSLALLAGSGIALALFSRRRTT